MRAEQPPIVSTSAKTAAIAAAFSSLGPSCLALTKLQAAGRIENASLVGWLEPEPTFFTRARVAELADALASGASDRKVVEVRVLSRAPNPFEGQDGDVKSPLPLANSANPELGLDLRYRDSGCD